MTIGIDVVEIITDRGFEVGVFFDSVLFCMALVASVILFKMFLTFLSCILFRTPIRISLIVGMRLAQIGEFSLILAAISFEQGLFNNDHYQVLLIVSILSMLVTPLMIQISSKLSIWIFSSMKTEESKDKKDEALNEHVIISGYGLGGRTLAKVLQEAHIPFIVLELSGEKVKRALTEGLTTHYGDCTQEETLLRAGVKRARMIVYAINDQAVSYTHLTLPTKA